MTYDLAGFRRFTRQLKLESRKPLVLEPFQLEIFADHFGPARTEIVLIPKKNYKTTSMGALALFHLQETLQADVPILAASINQARIMFRQAEKLVRNSGDKDEKRKDVYHLGDTTYEVRPGYKEIRANGGVMYVVANDADTLDGVIPTLALVDELHRHKTADNYGILSDGLGPRGGRMVTISTAGEDERTPLGVLRAGAHKWRNRKVDDRHVRYQSRAEVLHEWALDPERDDPENLRTVKRVNPAKTQTLAELRRRRHEQLMTTGRWLRFACGIWTPGDEPDLEAGDWDALARRLGAVADGDEVVLAPSVGRNAVIGIAAMRPGGQVAVRAEHLEPEPGTSIMARTENLLVELCDRYRVLQVLDPAYGMQRSMELVEARGVPVVQHPYSAPRRVAATGTFDRYLRAGDLIHDGDKMTRAHVLSARKKSGETGERFLVDDDSRAIEALSMAVHAATAAMPDPPMAVFA